MAVLWKAYFEVYPLGVVLRVPPPMVAGHTSMGSAYAFATTVCPFYTDAAGGVATVIRPRGSGPCAALHMAHMVHAT